MDTFITGFISGIISLIAVYIFIQSIRKRKGSTSPALQSDIDRNNIDTGQGLDKLTSNNSEAGRVTAGGLEAIDNTSRTVSEIIAAAIGDGKEEPEG